MNLEYLEGYASQSGYWICNPVQMVRHDGQLVPFLSFRSYGPDHRLSDVAEVAFGEDNESVQGLTKFEDGFLLPQSFPHYSTISLFFDHNGYHYRRFQAPSGRKYLMKTTMALGAPLTQLELFQHKIGFTEDGFSLSIDTFNYVRVSVPDHSEFGDYHLMLEAKGEPYHLGNPFGENIRIPKWRPKMRVLLCCGFEVNGAYLSPGENGSKYRYIVETNRFTA